MKITGVVSEFNPFHRGHEYLLNELRQRGAEIIICVMSGNFVQRGEAAIADKYSRAAMAVRCGADVVVELPYPYSSASAEPFATAGVSVLARLGVTHLGFGSECADIDRLTRGAGVLMSSEFISEYRRLCRGGQGSAAAYAAAFEAIGGEGLCGSNDILALEYIKAAYRGGHSLSFDAVPRAGGLHDSSEATGIYLSAKSIRAKIFSSGVESVSEWMPPAAYAELKKSVDEGLAPASLEKIGTGILAMLRLDDMAHGREIAECGGGLAQRLRRAAMSAGSLEELYRLASAKNYTDARIRRGMLFYLTGVRREDITREPAYTLLLAASKRGIDYLSSIRRQQRIHGVSKPADAGKIHGGARQYSLSLTADSLWTLTLPKAADAGLLLRRGPVLI